MDQRPAERVVQARVLFLLRDPGGALRDAASPLIHCTNTDDGLTEWRIGDAPLNACERELCRDFLAWLLTRFPPVA